MKDENIKVGQAYRDKSGTLFQIDYYDESMFNATMLDPNTKERSEFVLEGEAHNLPLLLKERECELIDLKTHVPTGLIEEAEDEN